MLSKRKITFDKQNSSPLKIVVVGDGMVGKTAMCKSYLRKSPYLTYQPTISETHEVTISIHKRDYDLIIWDTAGVEEWDSLRVKDYVNTDCFLLCYAVNNNTSFSNIESRWMPELRQHCPNVPVILVGTKTDCRNPSNRWISDEQGQELKNKVKATGFAECNNKSIASIEGVFIQAVILADKHHETVFRQNSIEKRCCLL